MVITDKFVYIHMPKTGGTFVTHVLSQLHSPVEGRPDRYGPISVQEPKHGTCHDIPVPHRKKPVLSTVRNPYEWYVSQYEFAWWKRTFLYQPESYPTPAGSAVESVLQRFQDDHSHFPEIAFEEFVDLCCRAAFAFKDQPQLDLGLYTKSFVAYHFQQPAMLLPALSQKYIASGGYRPDMFNVRFIRTDLLNQQLLDFLRSMEYREEDLQFLPNLKKILPDDRGRREDQKWEKYYTNELRELIRQKDRALFEMFPDFDI